MYTLFDLEGTFLTCSPKIRALSCAIRREYADIVSTITGMWSAKNNVFDLVYYTVVYSYNLNTETSG